MGPNLMKVIERYYNNSLENVGNHDSFVWYGPRWAQAATAPHRMCKMYSTGAWQSYLLRMMHMTDQSDLQRVDFEFQWYYATQDSAQSCKMGGSCALSQLLWTLLLRFLNWLELRIPFLQVSRLDHIKVVRWQACAESRGSRILAANRMQATSYTRTMIQQWDGNCSGGQVGLHLSISSHSLIDRTALRKGQWKILHVAPAAGGREDGKWQLYDVVKDPGETNDLSESMPDKVEELLLLWNAYVKETGTVWGEDVPPIGGAQNWAGVSADIIGGDPLEQTKAWMRIPNGETLKA